MIDVDGAKLTVARVRANKSLQDIAVELCCNKSQVSRWEQDKLIPTEKTILKLIELLGTSDFVVENKGKLAQLYLKDKLEGAGK
jgi:transcriptional regulator with XRE-family HTH domain